MPIGHPGGFAEKAASCVKQKQEQVYLCASSNLAALPGMVC